ncbi:MAG: tetratricopeptide repeat protein [Cyanobacteria bacterium SZAS LIN-5]|nr:tetratricopeptide repeat protein [Cyanobacteria bacterium SZAS LIN-5]RTL42540.1 MAG: tetratricopeptide repeat protein [Candidatus Melainabacteria bacterium]
MWYRAIEIDINQPLVGITLFLSTVMIIILARKTQLLYGPRSRPGKVSAKTIGELEVKIKLNSGAAVLDDMISLIQLYRKANRFEEAERYCKQALLIAEAEKGSESEILVPVLTEYANVLTGMRRKVEADKLKERARQLSKNKSA